MVMARIVFLRIEKKYDKDSPRGCSDYVHRVGSHEVCVEVHADIMDLWKVGAPDVKQAAKLLIENEAEANRLSGNQARLVLDEFNVKPVTERLGWKPRK